MREICFIGRFTQSPYRIPHPILLARLRPLSARPNTLSDLYREAAPVFFREDTYLHALGFGKSGKVGEVGIEPTHQRLSVPRLYRLATPHC
jgi:hypothetical protein